MNASNASVQPVEETPTTDGGDAPIVRMKDIEGMPGTRGGLALRCFQFGFAVAAFAVMAASSDFPSVSAFSYLVAAAGLQGLWSLSLAVIDIYALLVKRSLQNRPIVSFFAVGDGVTTTLTFAAACACAGITVLINNDLDLCSVNDCVQLQSATAMAFLCWFITLPSFFFNFWSLASR
ncbi:CASP-like protein 5A2 [Momordica charantia]|uniref:CASP-like protein n=1 Tax=Momordica charantia TaxID=3673 RepID=A0A6J1CFI4_MOMCH|nr:CASP-like protein 5A2 [Momordica charantia]